MTKKAMAVAPAAVAPKGGMNVTVRFDDDDLKHLDSLVAALERDRSWVIRRLIRRAAVFCRTDHPRDEKGLSDMGLYNGAVTATTGE